ncbi:MAG TPA: cytochrome P450 [Candidatus Acidoferrales bacterium]|nr:cytochrome P450 [Candidatus Acidoferrales bacterium]
MATSFEVGGVQIDFDPASPEFRTDPYPYLHMLRSHAPVCRADLGQPCWLVTGYASVMDGFRDRRLSADRFHLGPPEMQSSALMRGLASMMLLRDPPDHTRLRTLVSKAFTPRVVEELRPRIREITDRLIARVFAKGSMELMDDLAAPLPAMVIAQLLGVPPEDHQQFKQWSDDLIVIADGSLAIEGLPAAERSAAALIEYLERIMADRQRSPQNDLISGLVAARDQGDALTHGEMLSTCILLLIAGHETTTNLIGNGILTLLRHPQALEDLRRDPGLIGSAVEELLRFESPIQLMSRVAIVDLELGSVEIPAGREVVMMLGAANRDPAEFPEPDRLDLRRTDNHHVAFGHGIHFCLGAALARLEGQIAIGTIVRELPNLRQSSSEVEWKAGLMLRGLKRLTLEFGYV